MKKIKCIIHSFIDIITNSSTEIYVMSDENTVNAVYNVLRSYLKAFNSTHNVYDVFDVYLVEDKYAKGIMNIGIDVKIEDSLHNEIADNICKLIGSVDCEEIEY